RRGAGGGRRDRPSAAPPPPPRPSRGLSLLRAARGGGDDARHLGAAVAAPEPARADLALVLTAALSDRHARSPRRSDLPRRTARQVYDRGGDGDVGPGRPPRPDPPPPTPHT